MGIIISQSIKNMVTTYIGFGIGAVNTLFLFTYFLDKEYYGLVSFLLSAANLIWPFLVFGVHSTLIKFFTSYKTRGEQDRLLNLVLLIPLGVALITGSLGLFFYEQLLDYFKGENSLVQPYIWLIFLIALATSYFEIFFSWSKLYYKSSFGNFMKEVFHRFCISLLLFAVYFKWIEVNSFIYAISGVFVIRTIIMAMYAFSLHRPNFSFRFPKNLSPVLKYSALILVAASVATVLLDLDKVMIEYYLPIENVAVYGIAVYIATVISVPQKAMHQITNPLTAEMLNNRDRASLKDLYVKSSLNLFIVSGLIFIWIITNVESLYELIPDEYEISLLVVMLISLVKLYDNFLGNNNSILFNSDYYRIVLGVGVVLVILAFLLNLYFIPEFGIKGAAMASFIAFFLYNTSKIFIVYRKFGAHPFTGLSGLVLLIMSIFTVGFFYLETGFHPILDILIKGSLSGLLYISLIYLLKISPEINNILNRLLKRA
ncbi:polysaccharide biosynthesis C-terminal domain-containing protein [Gramella sp. GC03-9]|uniref:Polysaccharide biosynthesis C-terminal domain-containing protein n=1 Tax=Christiangramia oceanisediminis TaxID=2920386 RepID=A0A9X2KYP4_9FLAO|nr:polysaccharide biosynthesis C-terminal domain-containing protein [Gramella oceanisediminis]MCP9200669.1 polysaccharide biosynthesis C-terminal domain-containing protein [Gramella oceanisediminis]